MDRTGRVAIAPAFAGERDFFHGLAAVAASQKWGYIDETGKISIAPRFDSAHDFLDNLAPVRIGRKWGYIDTSGRLVIEPRFQAAGEFHEGLARILVWRKSVCINGEYTSDDAPLYAFFLREDEAELPGCFPLDGKFGYIDKTGKTVIAPQFADAEDFSEGLAAVYASKHGYIDRTGRFVIAPRFNHASRFSEGLAAVETSARLVGNQVVDIAWGFIDKTGVLKIPDMYEQAGDFSEGLASVTIKAGAIAGYVNHDGRMVIPAQFFQARGFSEGFAAVCSDNCFYINRSGVKVLKRFRANWPFSDGLAVIGTGAPQVYIDKKGRVVATYDDGKS